MEKRAKIAILIFSFFCFFRFCFCYINCRNNNIIADTVNIVCNNRIYITIVYSLTPLYSK